MVDHHQQCVRDQFCAAFAAAPDALAAALAAQQALQAEPWPPTGLLRVRIALHTGTSQEREGDYFGAPLNRVIRLLETAHGGQVLLWLATQELVRDHLPEGVTLRDLGEHRLKDLARPEPGALWAIPARRPRSSPRLPAALEPRRAPP